MGCHKKFGKGKPPAMKIPPSPITPKGPPCYVHRSEYCRGLAYDQLSRWAWTDEAQRLFEYRQQHGTIPDDAADELLAP